MSEGAICLRCQKYLAKSRDDWFDDVENVLCHCVHPIESAAPDPDRRLYHCVMEYGACVGYEAHRLVQRTLVSARARSHRAP